MRRGDGNIRTHAPFFILGMSKLSLGFKGASVNKCHLDVMKLVHAATKLHAKGYRVRTYLVVYDNIARQRVLKWLDDMEARISVFAIESMLTTHEKAQFLNQMSKNRRQGQGSQSTISRDVGERYLRQIIFEREQRREMIVYDRGRTPVKNWPLSIDWDFVARCP